MTEADMIAGTKAGNRRAIEALLTAHLPMMRKLAGRWARFVHLDDLLQRARLSLIRAAEMYQPGRRTFASYASQRIRADVKRMAVYDGSDVREEGADALPLWHRSPVVAVRYEHHETLAPDEALGMYAHAAPTQEEPLCVRDLWMVLRLALPALTPRQRSVVEHMLAEPDQTGEEVAAALSMGTRENVRQVRRVAFAALRCHPAIRSIARDYGLLEAA